MSQRFTLCAWLMLLAVSAFPAASQQLAIDRGVRLADLWCFPTVADERVWVYLPSSARLATDDEGLPQFSFLHYVVPQATEAGDTGQSLREAGGGGVLHFLVLYETPEEQVEDAQRLLRQRFDDDTYTLRGPVVFDRGRFGLVSSIVDAEAAGGTARELLRTGRAPVLEGDRLALSFDLDPRQASLLMESLQMDTPDVSLVFELTFSGLTDAFQAELVVDWSEVRRSDAFSAGGSIYFVGADVEVAFERLQRDNAIQLRSEGSDEAMEALLGRVYDKLLELMFRPVEPERIAEADRGDIMDAIGALIDPDGGLLSSRNTTGFGASVGYQLKDLRTEGVSVLNFDHRATVQRNSFVTFNIGDLWRRFGDDERFFRRANTVDPSFQQREVTVSIDGALLDEFENYINSVVVTLRKEHENGDETLAEIVLDKRAAEAMAAGESLPDLRMVYGWNDDADRLAWLSYDYRTHWSFKGGGSYQTDWQRTDSPMIDLFTPYERRRVQLIGADLLAGDGVRAVVVRLDYPFFGEERQIQEVVRPDRILADGGEAEIEITLPLDQFEYGYSIQWMLDGGDRLSRDGRDGSGVLFLDEMPPRLPTDS